MLCTDYTIHTMVHAHFNTCIELHYSLLTQPALHMYHFKPPVITVSPHLEAIQAATGHQDLCEREKAYVQSAQALASGNPDKATDELCAMLLDHPGGDLSI